MKKFTQKGFTLVELLAVIVVLGIILVIAVPSITGTINNAKGDSFATSAKMMKSNAVTFVNTAAAVSLPTVDDHGIVVSHTALSMENLTTDAFDNTYAEKYVLLVCDDGSAADADTDCEDGYKYYVTLHSGNAEKGFFNVLVSNLDSDTLNLGVTAVNIDAVTYTGGSVTLDVAGDGTMDAGAITVDAVCTSATSCVAP